MAEKNLTTNTSSGIADVNEQDLKQVTLVNNPHFVVFSSKTSYDPEGYVTSGLRIVNTVFEELSESENMSPEQIEEIVNKKTRITIYEDIEDSNSKTHIIQGTYNPLKVNSKTFFVARPNVPLTSHYTPLTAKEAQAITAQNIRKCWMENIFLKHNYEITAPPIVDGQSEYINGNAVFLQSKGRAKQPGIHSDEDFISFFLIMGTQPDPLPADTIDYGTGNYQLELDVYTGSKVFLGAAPSQPMSGKYVTTLTKAYFGNPLWFDLNALMSKQSSYSSAFLHADGWVDAGTVNDYYFVAKRTDKINHEAFYNSPILYAINGYDYTLEANDLSSYIFDIHERNTIHPLTTRPATQHTIGQKQYFNFILKDELHSQKIELPEIPIGILYKIYTQSGKYLGEMQRHQQPSANLHIVNTIELGLDSVVASFPTGTQQEVGRIDVHLCCNGIEVSHPIVYNMQPDNRLYMLNDFAFLNRLGGWDSVNFGGATSSEFKTSSSTFYKTLQPNYRISSEIESVSQKWVTEQKTAQTAPIDLATVEWLRQLSASTTVYELTSRRYVLVDELVVKYNSKDDLYLLEMKYHYSDTFNTQIK